MTIPIPFYKLYAMKYLLLIFAFISCSPKIQYDPLIPKNANRIVVKGVSFDEVVAGLLDAGYSLDKVNKDYQTVKTEYRNMCEKCVPQMYYEVRVKDSIAIIRGKWRSNGDILFGIKSKKDEDNAYQFDIKYNLNAAVPKETWRRMNNFAHRFNKPVSYELAK